jgi:hypothetical protein
LFGPPSRSCGDCLERSWSFGLLAGRTSAPLPREYRASIPVGPTLSNAEAMLQLA